MRAYPNLYSNYHNNIGLLTLLLIVGGNFGMLDLKNFISLLADQR